MHEYALVAALVEQVGQVAQAAPPGATVRRVHVTIGELAGVERALFATAFETFRARTVCDGAALVIHAVAARWECPRCGAARARGEVLRCPACDLPARLASGDEIVLERVELEVP
jgi:hydrogenase nickel incorporation protein HypA/HybF